MNGFAIASDLTIDVMRIGNTREPVLVIDDFLVDPAPIMAAAQAAADWQDVPAGGYPGRRAALPGGYVRALLLRLDGPIRRELFNQPMALDRFDCSFSMVTRRPDQLSPLQQVPHIDIARGNRVAILHYLCGPPFGGTAFFRQIATGLEQVGPQDRSRYLAARAAGLENGAGSAYPSEYTAGYEQTAAIDARCNRLIAYRSFTLHSGIIPDPGALSADPAAGRLTTNLFVDYRPAAEV